MLPIPALGLALPSASVASALPPTMCVRPPGLGGVFRKPSRAAPSMISHIRSCSAMGRGARGARGAGMRLRAAGTAGAAVAAAGAAWAACSTQRSNGHASSPRCSTSSFSSRLCPRRARSSRSGAGGVGGAFYAAFGEKSEDAACLLARAQEETYTFSSPLMGAREHIEVRSMYNELLRLQLLQLVLLRVWVFRLPFL